MTRHTPLHCVSLYCFAVNEACFCQDSIYRVMLSLIVVLPGIRQQAEVKTTAFVNQHSLQQMRKGKRGIKHGINFKLMYL